MEASDDESEDHSGLITFELVRRTIADSESLSEGIESIYKIGKTLGK